MEDESKEVYSHYEIEVSNKLLTDNRYEAVSRSIEKGLKTLGYLDISIKMDMIDGVLVIHMDKLR